MKLNIGCGDKLLEGYTNVDRINRPDVKWADLEQALPFGANTHDEIRANHVMEHITNFIPLMNSCHDVLKPEGVLEIAVPCLPHLEAFQDPTHVRFFTDRSFLYFVEDNFYWQDVGKNYDIKPFRKIKQHTKGFELLVTLTK